MSDDQKYHIINLPVKADRIYNVIVKHLDLYKKYPTREYLSSFLNVTHQKIIQILQYLVDKGRLQYSDDGFYIPGREDPEKETDKTPETVNSDISDIKLIEEEKNIISFPVIEEFAQSPFKHEEEKNKKDNPVYYNPEEKTFVKTPGKRIRQKKNIKLPEFPGFIKKKKIFNLSFLKINMQKIFNLIIFAVFIDFVYIGIKYNYYGNLKFKDPLDALTSAVAFMLSAIVFFKMSINSFQKKHITRGLIFLIIYFALFGYNTGTILQHQYDKFQDKTEYSESKIQSQKDTIKVDRIKKDIEILENELTSKRQERSRQEKILSGLNRENDKDTYNFYYWNINGRSGLTKKIDSLIEQIEKKAAEEIKLTETTNIIQDQKKTLFTGRIMKIYLFFPSFVIELLASISLVLLTQKRDIKNKIKRKNKND